MAAYKRALPWIVWFLASVFYAYQYILRILPSITIDETMNRFQVDASQFGQFSGIYYLGYTAMHIPLGIMLDHVGPRKILPLSILLIVVGLTPMLFGHSWVLACAGRFLIGAGSSAAILGIFKIVRMSFPDAKFGRMLSIAVTIGLVGAIYGSQPMNFILSHIGLNSVIYLIMAAGLILAFFIYAMVPAHKKEASSGIGIITEVKSVLQTPQVLLICLSAGLMVGPMEGFADVWGPSFLKTVYGIEEAVATALPSLIYIGMGVCGPLLAILAERTNRYYEIIIGSAVVMATIFGLLLFGKVDTYLISGLLFITGLACSYQMLAIYKASTYVKESLTGLTTACANMIIMAFGYVFHSSIGRTMESLWDGQIIEGIHVYSAQAYITGHTIIPAALLLGGIGFIIVRSRSKRVMLRLNKERS
jgi:MFS family permease